MLDVRAAVVAVTIACLAVHAQPGVPVIHATALVAELPELSAFVVPDALDLEQIAHSLLAQDAWHAFYSEYLEPILIERKMGSQGHETVAHFLTETMRDLGWTTNEDVFEASTPRGSFQFRNIIATKHPEAPYRLVLAAHYDSKTFDQFSFLGATDSAAPCAMMLKIASLLNNWLDLFPKPTNITLEYIFFDGEEALVDWTATDSIYGARHLAKKLHGTPSRRLADDAPEQKKTALDDIDLFVLLDLLGAPRPSVPKYFRATSKAYDHLAQVEKHLRSKRLWRTDTQGRPFLPSSRGSNIPTSTPQIEDDHRPFLALGVPVLHLIPVPFPAGWHSAADNLSALDPDTTLDWTILLAAFVAERLRSAG